MIKKILYQLLPSRIQNLLDGDADKQRFSFFWKLLIPGLLIIGLSVLIGYLIVNQNVKNLQRDTIVLTRGVASLIDSSKVEKLSHSPGDNDRPEYQFLRQRLLEVGRIYKDHGIRWLYTIIPRGDDLIFSVDSIPSDVFGHSEPGEVYDSVPPSFKEAFFKVWQGKEYEFIGPYEDKWGKFMTVLIPIYSGDRSKVVSVLGVDIDYQGTYFNKTLGLMAFILFVGVLLACVYCLTTIYITELKRKDRRTELSENKLEEIVGSLVNSVYILDQKYSVIQVFSSEKKRTGATDPTGEDKSHLDFVLRQKRVEAEEAFTLAKKTGDRKSFEYEDEPNGQWWRVTVSYLPDGNFSWMEEDNTERHKFEEKIVRSNNELESLNVAMIGRELKMIELKKKIADLEADKK